MPMIQRKRQKSRDLDEHSLIIVRAPKGRELEYFNDVTLFIETEGTYRDIITEMLNVYMRSVSNNLNRVIKTLAAVTLLMLAPTIISGLYGMSFAILELH